MKTLLVVALLVQSAQGGPPDGLRATLRQLREHLDEHKQTFGATAELTAAKHVVGGWIESELAAAGQRVDVTSFGAALHASLERGQLLCNDLHEECDWNFLGYVDDVRVSRAGEFLIVVTAVGIWCGFDESAYVYAWDGRQWARRWEHEQDTYTAQQYRPQTIQDVQISAPDTDGSRLIMTLGSQTICGGSFKDLYVRVWRTDSDRRASRVLDWSAHGHDAYLQGRVFPDAALFQFSAGGLLSGEVHTAVRHFKIQQGAAIQIDPVATLPRDFVVEWLSARWEESRLRSESAALQARHTVLHRDDGVGDFPEATTRCGAGSDLWQVTTHLYERPKNYFRVRWQSPYRFTMVDVSDRPYADCTVADSRGDTYPEVLDHEAR